MEMQKAEIVPGLRFRGRKVYLEQKGKNKPEVDADFNPVKRDCLYFAMVIKKLAEKNKPDNLIWTP